MSIASSIIGKQLPAHSIWIKIYSGITWFPFDSSVLVWLWEGIVVVTRLYSFWRKVILPLRSLQKFLNNYLQTNLFLLTSLYVQIMLTYFCRLTDDWWSC